MFDGLHRCDAEHVCVFDPSQGRLSIFTTKGAFFQARTFDQIDGLADGAPWEIVTNESGVVAYGQVRGMSPPSAEGPFRPALVVSLIHAGGRATAVEGSFRGDELYFLDFEIGPRPLGHRTALALSSRFLFLTQGDSAFVDVHDLQGRHVRRIEVQVEPSAVTPALLADFIEERIHSQGVRSRSPQEVRRAYLAYDYPATLPPFDRLLADVEGNVWVEEFRVPGTDRSRWHVYAPEGRLLNVVVMPPGLEAHDVGSDYVLGVWRDEVGAQRVRLHELTK